jgi:hypothetical protein
MTMLDPDACPNKIHNPPITHRHRQKNRRIHLPPRNLPILTTRRQNNRPRRLIPLTPHRLTGQRIPSDQRSQNHNP